MNAKRAAWFLKATQQPSGVHAVRITFHGDALQGNRLGRVANWLEGLPPKDEFGFLVDADGPRVSLYAISTNPARLRSFVITAKQTLPQIHCEPVAYPALRQLIQKSLTTAVIKPRLRALHPFHEDLTIAGQTRQTRRGSVPPAREGACHHDNVLANILNDVADTPPGVRRLVYITLRADRRRIFDGPKYKPPREEQEDKTDYSKASFLTLFLSSFGDAIRLLLRRQPNDAAAYEAKGTARQLFWCGILYVEVDDVAGTRTRQETLQQHFYPLSKEGGNAYSVKMLNPESRRTVRYLARLGLGQSIRYRSLTRRHLNWRGEAAELIMPPPDPSLLPAGLRRQNPALPPTAAESAQGQGLRAAPAAPPVKTLRL